MFRTGGKTPSGRARKRRRKGSFTRNYALAGAEVPNRPWSQSPAQAELPAHSSLSPRLRRAPFNNKGALGWKIAEKAPMYVIGSAGPCPAAFRSGARRAWPGATCERARLLGWKIAGSAGRWPATSADLGPPDAGQRPALPEGPVRGSGQAQCSCAAGAAAPPSSWSRKSTARRRCGITIEPPTTRPTEKVSKNSSRVTPASLHWATW